jgi:hypothetical protein
MNTQHEPTKTVFLQTVGIALGNLKQQLQRDYEYAYPELSEVIHLILDEEESHAWDLTVFPHLLLPDLVEAHVAQLNLRPAATRHADVFPNHLRSENREPIFALCA